MQWTWGMDCGQVITVHMDEIKTHRNSAEVIAQIRVIKVINGTRYYSIYSELGSSNRIARVALKRALRKARVEKAAPGTVVSK